MPLTDPSRFSILVVDDDSDVRKTLATMLTRIGHSVIGAESGARALQVVGDYLPDVIFSDIEMPRMSGYQLAEKLRLRLDTRSIFIVGMTGACSFKPTSVAGGFDAHISKPIELQTLTQLFDDLVLGRTKRGLET